MAVRSSITPARLNPTWVPAEQPLGPLAKFFGGPSSAPAVTRPSPVGPAPEMAVA